MPRGITVNPHKLPCGDRFDPHFTDQEMKDRGHEGTGPRRTGMSAKWETRLVLGAISGGQGDGQRACWWGLPCPCPVWLGFIYFISFHFIFVIPHLRVFFYIDLFCFN